MLRFFFVALWFLCLLPHALPHPCIGVTYSAPSGSSSHHSQEVERISGGLRQLKARSLRLENADPSITRSLLYTNTTLFLTIPNYMVSQIAQNRSVAESWLYTHVVPFYPRIDFCCLNSFVGINTYDITITFFLMPSAIQPRMYSTILLPTHLTVRSHMHSAIRPHMHSSIRHPMHSILSFDLTDIWSFGLPSVQSFGLPSVKPFGLTRHKTRSGTHLLWSIWS
ncbi:hypothetical protein VIGAN_03081300 [Vigna angularis var. angularis]|uniref:FAS1 domain-containing protein n=1 Tax=Vigna angularis var. angularis TaxID=157739 RepID=A0A0S3RKL1_PHAAN|nr:hypothetical protein VIGAN_03081300 [Vigna angularis var. angularis]